MKKSVLESMGNSTWKDVVKLMEEVENLMEDKDLTECDLQLYNEAKKCEINGYFYSTVRMSLKEVENACNNIVKSKRNLIVLKCILERS